MPGDLNHRETEALRTAKAVRIPRLNRTCFLLILKILTVVLCVSVVNQRYL
jgi:hypothetical protein